MDLYLVGILYLTYRWSWKPAVVLYLVSLVAAAWVLPPISSLAVSGGANAYRMFSYTITSVVAMNLIEMAKRTKEK